jgi:hypothetical protein
MSETLLLQVLAQLKDLSVVTASTAAKVEAADAKADEEAEYLVQDREARAQTANLIRIQFKKVGGKISSMSRSTGSSSRSSPKSAMSGNSQACSEMGEPIDTGAAQGVLAEMPHMTAEM